eukprot:snap_masked-scaffold_2-processed-gene-21.9-mRNA-1 protein AED:0.36 eAED:0.37 QI:0/0/0/0.5/1/1/2/0/1076
MLRHAENLKDIEKAIAKRVLKKEREDERNDSDSSDQVRSLKMLFDEPSLHDYCVVSNVPVVLLKEGKTPAPKYYKICFPNIAPKYVEDFMEVEYFILDELMKADATLCFEPIKLQHLASKALNSLSSYCHELDRVTSVRNILQEYLNLSEVVINEAQKTLCLKVELSKTLGSNGYFVALNLHSSLSIKPKLAILRESLIMVDFCAEANISVVEAASFTPTIKLTFTKELEASYRQTLPNLNIEVQPPYVCGSSIFSQRIYEIRGDLSPSFQSLYKQPSLLRINLFPEYMRVKQVACSDGHCLALMFIGMVFCWGEGTDGQLGFGDGKAVETPKPLKIISFDDKSPNILFTQVAAGSYPGGAHSIVLSVKKEVYTFGLNTACGHRGEKCFVPKKLEFGVGSEDYPAIVLCGGGYSICLFESGTAFSFGSYANGRLGLGEPERRHAVEKGLKALIPYSSSKKKTLEEKKKLPYKRYKLRPHPISIARMSHNCVFEKIKFVQIQCSENHCLASDSCSCLYGWGQNNFGQVGVGSLEDVNLPTKIEDCINFSSEIVKMESVTGFHCSKYKSYCINTKGVIFKWGLGTYRAGSWIYRRERNGIGIPKFPFKRIEDEEFLFKFEPLVLKDSDNNMKATKQFLRPSVFAEQPWRWPVAVDKSNVSNGQFNSCNSLCTYNENGELRVVESKVVIACSYTQEVTGCFSTPSYLFLITTGSKLCVNLGRFFLSVNNDCNKTSLSKHLGNGNFNLCIRCSDGDIICHSSFCYSRSGVLRRKILENQREDSSLTVIHATRYSKLVLKYVLLYLYCADPFTSLFLKLWKLRRIGDAHSCCKELQVWDLVDRIQPFIHGSVQARNFGKGSNLVVNKAFQTETFLGEVLKFEGGESIRINQILLNNCFDSKFASLVVDSLREQKPISIKKKTFFLVQSIVFYEQLNLQEVLADISILWDLFDKCSKFGMHKVLDLVQSSVPLSAETYDDLLSLNQRFKAPILENRLIWFCTENKGSPMQFCIKQIPDIETVVFNLKSKHNLSREDILGIKGLFRRRRPENEVSLNAMGKNLLYWLIASNERRVIDQSCHTR